MSNQATERRMLQRFPLRAPIDVDNVGQGITRDVSPNGVAFEIDAPLQPGDRIRFVIAFAEQALRLQGEGTVVRVYETGRVFVAAATIDVVEHVAGHAHAMPRRRVRPVSERAKLGSG